MTDLMGEEDEYDEEEYGEEGEGGSGTKVKKGKKKVQEEEFDFMWAWNYLVFIDNLLLKTFHSFHIKYFTISLSYLYLPN